METALAIFGGFGVGAIISQIVQYLLAQRAKKAERRTEELKEVFSGLLAAQASVIKNSNSMEHKIEFALWEARVQLVASPEISKRIEEMKATGPHSDDRQIAIDAMLQAMRNELGIAK
ncbi:MAG TPA: hypothetical protein VFC95_01560 [Guyparkeria sp.]|nr:hypothetical protein [Guyparkeria sp.]